MKKTRILLIIVEVVFVICFTIPATNGLAAGPEAAPSAGAGPVTLTITNPLPKAITVNLDGDKDYTINVPKGATITRILDAGKYKYSYLGCLNKPKKGNLKVKGTAATIKVPPCKMATWSWYNADDTKTATLKLKGWMDYTITVPPGQVVLVSWVADTYQATLTSCGKTNNGVLKVSGKKAWIIYACK